MIRKKIITILMVLICIQIAQSALIMLPLCTTCATNDTVSCLTCNICAPYAVNNSGMSFVYIFYKMNRFMQLSKWLLYE